MSGRYWEVDALRGIAIIMMVIFHLGWDLHYFGLSTIDVFQEPWIYWGRTTATLFLLLVGISLQISAVRARRTGGETAVWRRQWRRGLTVLAGGLAVTLVTYFAIGQGFIVFGILHFIGLAMLLAYPLLRLGWWNLLLALLCLLAGPLVQGIILPFPWLLWLGLRPAGFYTVDYYPLLPWLGIVLIGLALGDWLYGQGQRRLTPPDWSRGPVVRLLGTLGQRSLLIYLIHQPLLVGLLIATGLVPLSRLG